ncbi:MAG: HEAT repeat domain-containing protein [Lentisphaeria bacterium]|nr:HEAT repeat domain-containing protein [Lentisphaeria bacterium]
MRVVDIAKKKVIRDIPAGPSPGRMVLSPNGKILYVLNPEHGGVTAIDPIKGQPLAWVATGENPTCLAISNDGKRLYVGDGEEHTITVLRADFPSVLPKGQWRQPANQLVNAELRKAPITKAVIPLSRGLHSLSLSSDGRRALVSHAAEHSLSIYDLQERKELKVIQLHSSPAGLAMNKDASRSWVCVSGGLLELDLKTGKTIKVMKQNIGASRAGWTLVGAGREIRIGKGPVRLSSDEKRAYIVGDNRAVEADLVAGKFVKGLGNGTVLAHASGFHSRVYLQRVGTDAVWLSAGKGNQPDLDKCGLKLSQPSSAAVSPDGQRLFLLKRVRSRQKSESFVICYDVNTKKELASIPLAFGGNKIQLSSNGGRLLVDGMVKTIINTKTYQVDYAVRLERTTEAVLSPDGKSLIALAASPEAILVIDLSALQLISESAKISVGTLNEFTKLLSSQDGAKQNAAITTLQKLNADSPDAVSYILEAINHELSIIRQAALEAIRRIGRPLVAKLAAQLGEQAAWPRYYIIQALGDLGPDAAPASKALEKHLETAVGRLRSATVKTLGKIGPDAKHAVPKLLEIAKAKKDRRGRPTSLATEASLALASIDPDGEETDAIVIGNLMLSEVSYTAAQRMGVRVVPQLIHLIQTNDRVRKQAAIRALGQIGPEAKEAVNALTELFIAKPSSEVARALGRIGVPKAQAIDALKKAMSAKSKDLQITAAYSYWQLHGDTNSTVPLFIKYIDHQYSTGKISKILLEMGDDAVTAIPAMVATLEKGKYNSYVGKNLIKALGTHGPKAKAAEVVLEKITRHGQKELRTLAKDALVKIREK